MKTTGRMTLEKAAGIVARISLGGMLAGWTFRVAAFEGSRHLYLQVRATERCNDTGAAAEWGGRKYHISEHAADSEVVLTALKAVLTAVEHEARECFALDGVRLFDPHTDVFDLQSFVAQGYIGRDVREDASEIFALEPAA